MSWCVGVLAAALAAGAPPESYLGVYPARALFAEEDPADPELAPGVVVERVVENSPAAAAGLKPGDAILRLNGVTLRNGDHLNALVAAQPVGSTLKIEARREVELLTLEAATVARVEPRAAPDVRHLLEARKLGLAVATLDAEESRTAGIGPGDGVRVRRVLNESTLAGKVEVGDVIAAIDGTAVHGGDDFLALARDLEPGADVKLGVVREGKPVELRVKARKPERYVSRVFFPLIVDYESKPKQQETSFGVLLYIFQYKRKENVRDYRFLWFIRFSTGTNEELEEVSE